MKQVKLVVETRDSQGSGAAKRLRNEGKLPAVFYGESGVRHLQLNHHDFAMAWRNIVGSAALIELRQSGNEEADPVFAIIKDVQRNARTDEFLHIDFLEIVRGREMEAEIPVKTRGVAHGVKNQGGVLAINLDTMNVRCRPRHLPEMILVDVTKLAIADSIHVRDLEAPEGVAFLDDPDLVVVACTGASGLGGGEEKEEGEEEATA